MAVRLLSGHEVSDLCLGKPALRSLSLSDTLADALSALKRIDDSYVSVWSCRHSLARSELTRNATRHHETQNEKGGGCESEVEDCRCVGRVCMVDIICFLCRPENLSSPAAALRSPISALLPEDSGLVRHLEPNARSVTFLSLRNQFCFFIFIFYF